MRRRREFYRKDDVLQVSALYDVMCVREGSIYQSVFSFFASQTLDNRKKINKKNPAILNINYFIFDVNFFTLHGK
jgi:hypothetical protein